MAKKGRPRVGILMGSDSDWPVLEQAAKMLESFKVAHEARVLSAHRAPEHVRRYAVSASKRGIQVLIAGAGGAAHLAGALAAQSTVPVIGIPVKSKNLDGLDSLLSTVQMPRGVPVATVAIDNATNAAILAVQILALADARLAKELVQYKAGLTEKNLKADQGLRRS